MYTHVEMTRTRLSVHSKPQNETRKHVYFKTKAILKRKSIQILISRIFDPTRPAVIYKSFDTTRRSTHRVDISVGGGSRPRHTEAATSPGSCCFHGLSNLFPDNSYSLVFLCMLVILCMVANWMHVTDTASNCVLMRPLCSCGSLVKATGNTEFNSRWDIGPISWTILVVRCPSFQYDRKEHME